MFVGAGGQTNLERMANDWIELRPIRHAVHEGRLAGGPVLHLSEHKVQRPSGVLYDGRSPQGSHLHERAHRLHDEKRG